MWGREIDARVAGGFEFFARVEFRAVIEGNRVNGTRLRASIGARAFTSAPDRRASLLMSVKRDLRSTNVPSDRKPPSVKSRCRCGCQIACEPRVCGQAIMPMTSSRSPVSVRIAAVTVPTATRAISPSRRAVQTIRAQPLGDGEHHLPVHVSTTCRCR